jgi:hypothetical protein
MKQTAIEWLEEQMKTWGDLPRWQKDDIIQQAKEMEKQQVIDAFDEGVHYGSEPVFTAGERYYTETFKSE